MLSRRLVLLLAAVAAIAAACTDADIGAEDRRAGEVIIERPPEHDRDDGDDVPIAEQPLEDRLRALAPRTVGPLTEPIRETSVGCEDDGFVFDQPGCEPAAMIELSELVTGGPAPDGIPSIDDPRFETVPAAAAWLDERSPVIVLEHGDVVRLYPLEILIRHEIVNDVVAGDPIAVTYCPLCNSALAFDRVIKGPDGPEVLEFGTTGRLWRSNLVMYDRQHLELWTQFTGQQLVGERFLGRTLDRRSTSLLGFGTAAGLYPDAEVLSRDTGSDHDYERTPYVFYDREDNVPPFLRGDADDRLPPMTRVVGIHRNSASAAVVVDHLAVEEVVELEVAGDPITVWWAPGQASVLERARVEDGKEVGQAVVFLAEHDGRTLRFAATGGGRFEDVQTGSIWDLRGEAVAGPLAGARLTPLPRDDALWFAWAVFRPDTTVVGGG